MRVSADGRVDLHTREGERLVAYRDSVGVWTIGTGHTGRMAPPAVYPGMRITKAQSDAFLEADLAPVEAALNRVLKVSVTQNQFDAMASLFFNVGIGYAKSSTRIIERLNAGDLKGAADGFDLFRKPPEIIGRRKGEKRQFQTPDGFGRELIREIQTDLAVLGFTMVGAADGVIGKNTHAALLAFEMSHGLPPDGALDQATIDAIRAAKAPSAPAIPPLKPEPALAGTPPAPATVPSAAKEEPMSPAITADIKAEVPNVDFFQGAVNTVGHWIGTLSNGLSAAKDPKNTKVSAEPGGPGFFGTIGNIQKAIHKLGEIKSAAEKKDVQEAIADGVDLLTLGFATMSAFNINLPVATAIFASGINLHSGGVDKPA